MIITFFRSSSYNCWSYCEQKFFFSYVLGYQERSNLRADMGTIVHKALEIMAALKKFSQDNPNAEVLVVNDDAVGEFQCRRDELLKPTTLTDKEIDVINKSRTNKQIYKHDVQLPYGHVRYGVDVMNRAYVASYEYYSNKYDHHEWTSLVARDVLNWCWMAVEYMNGICDPRKRTIVEPEQRFDLTVDEPWAEYSYEEDGKPITGRLALKGTIDLITQVDDDTYEIIDWKGLPIETPIPTTTGWTTMGDIQVGDTIFDEDGALTKVVGKSKVKYKDCYRLYFDDCTTAESDDEHLWKLSDGSVVVTTELKVGDKINLTKAIQTDDVELPIDPYVLGIWLGDGRKRNGEITSADPYIYQEIERRGYSIGEDISYSNRCEQRTVYGLRTQLRHLGLLNNKHIPKIYLRASISQRMELLKGLMDSDGSVNMIREQAVFTSCNKTLSDNVKELLISLGQRPNQGHVYNNQFDRPIAVYPIHFRPIGINPFSLPRKANSINANWGSGQSHRRLIKSIEYIGKKETQCIAVDSKHHTYLCTKNMIVTHNTGQRLDWSTGERKDLKKLCSDPQLMLYYYAAKRLYPDKNIILTIFFVRDGGPFSICFDDEHIPAMETLLRERFEEIKNSQIPKLLDDKQKDFRCTRLCHFYKNKWPGSKLNMCRFIHNQIRNKGIEKVTKEYKNEGHSFNTYNAPGE